MQNSIKNIRSWLADKLLYIDWLTAICLAFFVPAICWFCWQIGERAVQAQTPLTLAQHQRIVGVSVTNGSSTTFTNPLQNANFIQLSLNPGDAQVFTYCPPEGGQCIQIPSGQSYEIGPLRNELQGGQVLGTVQTATDGATLQVVAQRVQ